MFHRIHPRSSFLFLVFAGCIAGSTSDTGVDDGGTEGDVMDMICQSCKDMGKIAYDCACNVGGGVYEHADFNCASNDTAANTACDADCPSTYKTDPWSCETNRDSGSCSSWAPETQVSYSGGVYHVDVAFMAVVTGNSSPLWTCDNATLDPQPGGGYVVGDADAGELLYELGLRDGDIPQSINGMPLLYISQAAEAYADLYLSGEDNYALVVNRGGSSITLTYVLD